MKKILIILMSLLVLFTGCAKDDPKEEAGKGDGERPYYVRPANEVTGTLTVYTTMDETQQNALKDVWYKYYPDTKLEIQSDSIGTLATRIRGDGNSDVDVIIGGLFEADGDAYHDILQPYTAKNVEELNYVDPSGYYTFLDVQLMCLIVNTQLKEELGIEINSYADLLQPELKGKIILAAPDSASSGYRHLQTILRTMGDKFDDEKAWTYIEKLMEQSFSTTSSRDVYNLVINGEYVVGLSWESIVDGMIKDGAPVEMVYMSEGNTAMATGGAIVKDAPNLVAAQAMMDLLASVEHHNSRLEYTSSRSSNKNGELRGLKPESEINLLDLDFEYLRTNKANLLDKWNTLWAKTH